MNDSTHMTSIELLCLLGGVMGCGSAGGGPTQSAGEPPGMTDSTTPEALLSSSPQTPAPPPGAMLAPSPSSESPTGAMVQMSPAEESPAASPTPTAPIEPSPFAGMWVGQTTGGLELGFTVNEAGVVDSMMVTMQLRLGLSTCTGPAVLSGIPAPIEDGSFTAIALFPASSVIAEVTGSFSEDGLSATGSYDSAETEGSDGYFAACGDTFSIGTGDPLQGASWTARRGNFVCDFTRDGECDEPAGTGICLRGTDSADCSGPAANPPGMIADYPGFGSVCADVGCPSVVGALCEEEFTSNPETWWSLTSDDCEGSDLNAPCVGQTQGQKYCSRACSSNVDCEDTPVPMICNPPGGLPLPDLDGVCVPSGS